MFKGALKIVAMLDQLRAQRAHGRVLLRAVAMWNDDHGPQAHSGSVKSDTLSVIPPCGGDDAAGVAIAPRQFLEVHQAAANLEGSYGRVVLVLHPHLGTGAGAQKWPTDLRGWRHGAVHHLGRGLERVEVWKLHVAREVGPSAPGTAWRGCGNQRARGVHRLHAANVIHGSQG